MEKDEDEETIWEAIGSDAIEGARLCRQQIKLDNLSVQDRRRRRIAEGYYIGLRLMEDFDEWQRFLADPFFDQDPRIRNKKEDRFKFIVMRTVMIYLFMAGKNNPSLRNRTWRYARAMDGYAEEGVHPEEAAAKIKKDGGIEKLARARSKGRDLEDEDKDWKLEMAHREPTPRAERARARDRRTSSDAISDDDEFEEESEAQEEALEPIEEADPTEGQVAWSIHLEPEEWNDLRRVSVGETIRVDVSVRRMPDGTKWYEAVRLDYLS